MQLKFVENNLPQDIVNIIYTYNYNHRIMFQPIKEQIVPEGTKSRLKHLDFFLNQNKNKNKNIYTHVYNDPELIVDYLLFQMIKN